MATVDMLQGGTTSHPAISKVKLPYVVERTLNVADVLVEKGSALAAADVIQALNIPADTFVFGAGVDVETAGNSTTLTLDVGDGSDADGYVDGVDGKTAANNFRTLSVAEGTPNTVVGYSSGKFYSAADTIDVTFATLTGTLSTGSIRVWAIVADVG